MPEPKPIHLLRITSYHPPAFDADNPRPPAPTLEKAVMTPSPNYDAIVGTGAGRCPRLSLSSSKRQPPNVVAKLLAPREAGPTLTGRRQPRLSAEDKAASECAKHSRRDVYVDGAVAHWKNGGRKICAVSGFTVSKEFLPTISHDRSSAETLSHVS